MVKKRVNRTVVDNGEQWLLKTGLTVENEGKHWLNDD